MAQCSMYAAEFVDKGNGEDLASGGGNEYDSSGHLLSKIILLAIKVLSKERFLHGKPRCGIIHIDSIERR